MMILLKAHSLTPRNRFMPERMQLQLSERTSLATLTLGDTAPSISVGDWMQYEEGPAKGIVWRVKTVETSVETNTRTVQLEHAINTLKDIIIFGETKPDDISGEEGVNPMASTTARYVLAHQGDWVLGAVERDRPNPYGFNGDDLYAALEIVSSSLTECVWEYDFTTYPFIIHLRAMNNSVATEMRTDRNIRTLRKTIDRSRMYTRHYPIGKEDLHITGDYVTRNEHLYGVICKTETDQSIETEEALRTWATERLNRHCSPIVTVTISGLDLSGATGEPLDSFRIGRLCRIPITELNDIISERVTKLNYADVINRPMEVTITLANELQDIASIIRRENQEAARGGRGSAKKAGEDHAWFVDTDEKVGMVAEALAGPGADKDWSRVSSIFVDGEGIHQKVTRTEEELVVAETRIEMNENRISLEAEKFQDGMATLTSKITVEANRITQEVNDRRNADSSLSSRITQTANSITQEVRERKDADTDLSGRITVTAREIRQEVTDTENRLAARITINSDNINLKVDKSGVISAINVSPESVDISASKINLSGYVTASDLEATNATISNLTSGASTANTLRTILLSASTGFDYQGHAVSFHTITINGTTYYLMGYR